jgi:hypothetical protein
MAKKTDYSRVDGTSFHNVTLLTSVNKLESILGESDYEANDGNDKVNFEWYCETKDGAPFTIYDWKQYRGINKDEDIVFHIGSFNVLTALEAKQEIYEQLTYPEFQTKED